MSPSYNHSLIFGQLTPISSFLHLNRIVEYVGRENVKIFTPTYSLGFFERHSPKSFFQAPFHHSFLRVKSVFSFIPNDTLITF